MNWNRLVKYSLLLVLVFTFAFSNRINWYEMILWSFTCSTICHREKLWSFVFRGRTVASFCLVPLNSRADFTQNWTQLIKKTHKKVFVETAVKACQCLNWNYYYHPFALVWPQPGLVYCGAALSFRQCQTRIKNLICIEQRVRLALLELTHNPGN